jgi:L-lactate dehydrogenase complex protein LldG
LFHLSQQLFGVFSRLAGARDGWLKMPEMSGWGKGRDFPVPSGKPFHDMFDELRKEEIEQTIEVNQAMLQEGVIESKDAEQGKDHQDFVESFGQQFEALNGILIKCSSNELGERIAAFLAEMDLDRVQAWQDGSFPPGVIEKLRGSGIRVQTEADPQIRAGLTGAGAAIAETGTLVLRGGAAYPLTASLLPEIHLAVLNEEDIVPDLHSALTAQEIERNSSVVLISGPSRTADIEMTLTMGVHGPREVVVFLYRG